MLVEGVHVGVGVVRVLVTVEGGVGFHDLGYLVPGPLVPGFAAQDVGPGDPAFGAIGVLRLVEPDLYP